MNFYLITVIVSVCILLLILFLIFITSIYGVNQTTWPPIASQCPDYWSVAEDKCYIPHYTGLNKGTIYDSSNNLTISSVPGFDNTTNSIQFSSLDWNNSGKSAICMKRDWCNSNSIVWDSVSNYNGC
jgi:hypothetical protein